MTAPASPAPRRPVRRFRSARRLPAALLALALLAAAGLLLYDLAAVQAGRSALQWRRALADALGRYAPADPEVLVAAGVLAVIGAVLLLLALAPGLRRVLMMLPPAPEPAQEPAQKPAAEAAGDSGGAPADAVRAGIGRRDAARVLRDRVMEVPGVRSAKVRVRRRRVAVAATSHFRELDDVRADLERVLASGIGELALAHPPHPRVRVARAAAGKR
ncbi:hypothetical protein C0216_22460 [Streptomyces globosus]|uniref:DUF6286 domain-containing protein n=1 Tax=Streptomyces globosus TaxID=68209 RepID=A0A344U4M6_9ACTN|nr:MULTISPECIES: DUF6286 domain-containing protein [Streptomyces]AXE25847.1 hypothetical protein C0216_22460 [Streptomyces globosus]